MIIFWIFIVLAIICALCSDKIDKAANANNKDKRIKIADVFFWIAVIIPLITALYFAISKQNYVYSLCYILAAVLLLITKPKKKK